MRAKANCRHQIEECRMNSKRIGISVVALTLAFLLSSLMRAQAAEGTPKPIVLKAAHLFDSVSGKLVEHGVIVVVGRIIQAVGSEAAIPADAQVIDLGDTTLLPGFI